MLVKNYLRGGCFFPPDNFFFSLTAQQVFFQKKTEARFFGKQHFKIRKNVNEFTP